jgi:TIR domain
MRPEELTKQVYLSHTRKEQDLANEIAGVLSSRGIKVWDDQQVTAGADWANEIADALKKSDSMIVLLRPYSYSSSWVRSELDHALFDERYKNRLLPVLIEEAEEEAFARLPWILTTIQSLRLSHKESTKSRAIRIVDRFIELLKGSKARPHDS